MLYRKLLIGLLLLVAPLIGHAQFFSALMPFDAEEINTQYPLFQWQQTADPQARGEYRFILVELNENQTPDEAVAVNFAIYQSDPGQSQFLQYSALAPELKFNQWYVWQVQYLEQGYLIRKTEARKFIIPKELPEHNKYVSLQRELNASYYQTEQGKLYFRINENYLADQLKIEVYDRKNKLVLTAATNDASSGLMQGKQNGKEVGNNYYELDLKGKISSGKYHLKVIDTKKRVYQLKFELL